MSEKIKIGITQGDPNGIGLEVTLKALSPEGFTDLATPVVFASPHFVYSQLDRLADDKFDVNIATEALEIKPGMVNVWAIDEEGLPSNPGVSSPQAGAFARKVLETATDALKKGEIDVLVTAPLSKETVSTEQKPFKGHTEFLEENFAKDSERSLMILFNGTLRVALLTTHLPLAKVAEAVTIENIMQTCLIFARSLEMDFAIDRPRIALLALNPHAGDGGLLGSEEEEIMKPAIARLREEGILIFGPYAADGLFGSGNHRKFDGIIAVYHDQGLAPFKALCGAEGVNFTAGLPVVRTSPDHGTAFEIAGKNVADETSMRNAIYEAIDIFRRRKNFKRASANPLKSFVQPKPDREERTEAKHTPHEHLTREQSKEQRQSPGEQLKEEEK